MLVNSSESRVASSDHPTIQLLLTVMAAAQKDMLCILNEQIISTRQRGLTPAIATDICRRVLTEFWKRPLCAEDVNN